MGDEFSLWKVTTNVSLPTFSQQLLQRIQSMLKPITKVGQETENTLPTIPNTAFR